MYRMSTKEEEFQARYGTQRIESDEDDELLGCRDDDDDDIIVTSSRHQGDHTSPSGMHMEDYEYDHELDYDEVIDADHCRANVNSRKTQVQCMCTGKTHGGYYAMS